jgi:hypothetical protein
VAITKLTGPGTNSAGVSGIGLGYWNAPLTIQRTQWRYATLGLTPGQVPGLITANNQYLIIPEGADAS